MQTTTGFDGPDHLAVPFGSPEQLAGRLTPRLKEALTAGAPVYVVLAAAEQAALRDVLGADADRVEFADPAEVHAVPPFTVAVRWARLARRVTRTRAVVVGQHVDLPGRGPEHWARLDIALNVAIDGLPVTVLCPYRSDARPGLAENHPLLLTGEGPQRSARYRPPPEAVVDFPPPPPPDLGPSDVDVPFGPDDLPGLRRHVAAAAAVLGEDRAADLVLAVNELASNSVEHGAGTGRLQLWTTQGSVIAEVADGGRMDVAFPGLVLPPPAGVRGRGLWLASELTDVLQVWTDGSGTVIRVMTNR